MAVYFKYKSAKDYDSIPIVDPFISVGNLKSKIFESKRYGRGKDFDIIITNAQSNQIYVDQHTLIAKNTSVFICRVPGIPSLPIVIPSLTDPKQVLCEEETHSVEAETVSAKHCSLDFECNDFGDDVYAIPKILPIHPVTRAPPTSSINEDTKIKNVIYTPDLRQQSSNGYGFGRGGMEWKKPPSGYVCHRCNVSGHFIQHCPTNGDTNYNIKKAKPPTKSMLMPTSSGSGGVLKPSEVEGLSFSSSCSSSSTMGSLRDIPPELHCPLCKGLMKDAVIASKCCFSSFCEQCIRNHIISNSNCLCGARNILVDALLPNITLRVTINRILESSNSSSSEREVSAPPRVEDIVSAHNAPLAINELQQKPTSGEAVKMKKRKKPCDVDVVNMPRGVAKDHVVAVYHLYSNDMQYMSYGHHALPEESFRGQYVETTKAGIKRKCEMSIEFPCVITC